MGTRLLAAAMCIALASTLAFAGCGAGHSEAEEQAVRAAFEESAKRCQTLADEVPERLDLFKP